MTINPIHENLDYVLLAKMMAQVLMNNKGAPQIARSEHPRKATAADQVAAPEPTRHGFFGSRIELFYPRRFYILNKFDLRLCHPLAKPNHKQFGCSRCPMTFNRLYLYPLTCSFRVYPWVFPQLHWEKSQKQQKQGI